MSNITINPSDVVFNWVIVQLECKASVDNLQDYVVLCHYRYNGTYQDIIKEVYGTCSFEIDPNKPDYIAYADLTESIIISWLEAGLEVQFLQNNILNQIDATINPPIVVLPLPWLPNPSEL